MLIFPIRVANIHVIFDLEFVQAFRFSPLFHKMDHVLEALDSAFRFFQIYVLSDSGVFAQQVLEGNHAVFTAHAILGLFLLVDLLQVSELFST